MTWRTLPFVRSRSTAWRSSRNRSAGNGVPGATVVTESARANCAQIRLRGVSRWLDDDVVLDVQDALGFVQLGGDASVDGPTVGLDDHATAIDALVLDEPQVLDVAGVEELVTVLAH